jgi:hypothetical protein
MGGVAVSRLAAFDDVAKGRVGRPLVARRSAGLTAAAALEGAVALILIAIATPPRVGVSPAPATTIEVVDVRPEDVPLWSDSNESAPSTAGARAAFEIAGTRIDLAKIAARRHALFPFLTSDLAFIGRIRQRALADRRRLRYPFGESSEHASTKPPLQMGEAQLQQVVDRAWSRTLRWQPFAPIAALTRYHDPQVGDVPLLLRHYTQQNLLQPYFDSGIRDPRFWTTLGLAADHVAFLEFVRGMASRYPSSRTTTELLFLADELAQASRDILILLVTTRPDADLRRTAAANPAAYTIALEIRDHYLDWLKRHDLESPDSIRLRYDHIRLSILSTIVETSPGGYRVGDARYLAGTILFEHNDLAGATKWWRAIAPKRDDVYYEAYSQIHRALARDATSRAAAVIVVLGTEYRRWLDFNERRLRQFAYTFETF